jgi:hypothetical protein
MTVIRRRRWLDMSISSLGPPSLGRAAMNSIARGRGLAANDRTVLTIALRPADPGQDRMQPAAAMGASLRRRGGP